MESDPGSTVPRRQLGRYLRQLREDARITVKRASEELEWSGPKIWRIEGGMSAMRALDVEAMCRLYGATPDTTEALMSLAHETKAKGWWNAHGDAVPGHLELYMGLESAASKLRTYEPELIPGMLQTMAYATAVFRTRQKHSEEGIRRRIAIRQERQKILTRTWPTPPRLEVVLNEAALRRPLHSPSEWVEQLRHILAVGTLPNVVVRVMPFQPGINPAANSGGGFVILDFPDTGAARGAEPTTVQSDGLTGSVYLDKPSEVEDYDQVWGQLIASALNEQRSRKWIAALAKEHSR
ncbi:helix-turn-helix domain-containing protein [Actinoplanes sp. NPDC051859]|uniref:helix-turn-helix domain-containing protein n=1 Tax=Actinoplanes sp. NPDC051859 TaxID=3363909 RepID=UPI0037B7E8EF